MTSDGKFKYVHIFTGKRFSDQYVEIDKSIIEFGDHAHKQNFQKPGERIFAPKSRPRYELKDVLQWIIEDMFKGRFDLSKASFRAG